MATPETEVITVKVPLTPANRWYVGTRKQKFLLGLKDEQKIYAIRCSKCGKVYIPPRKICGPCFAVMDEWVEVSGEGTLEVVSKGCVSLTSTGELADRSEPIYVGMIKLDGVDTLFIAEVKGDSDKIKAGARVKPAFREKRNGLPDDVYFEVT
jgi:hypothetical protein